MTSPLRPVLPAPAPQCVVGGVRVSRDIQGHRYGPERQRHDIQAAVERTGLVLWHWVEESVSGADHDRAAENLYYELARKHHGLNFMFSHPNRVGRHVEVTVGIARHIHALGGTVWIAGLGNLRDERNWKYFLREAAEAEIDYSNVVGQLYKGKRDKAVAGRWPHGAPPWGYKLARDERGDSILPVIDPATASAVRRVWELAETMGQVELVKTMRAEGWPAPTPETGWTVGKVANILHARRYLGFVIFAGVRVDFPALVSEEQWERVHSKRAQRRIASGPRATDMLLAGHVRCAVCGAGIGRDSHKTGGKQYVYYRCWRARRGEALRQGHTPCSNTRNWRPEELEGLCWDELVQSITTPERLAQIIAPEVVVQAEPPPLRIQELEEAITRAWEPFAQGLVPQSVAERLAAPFKAELEALRAEYRPSSPPPGRNLDAQAEQFRQALAGELTFDQRRRLLAALDVRFMVGSNGLERLSVSIP